jgi:hypothetical protein
MKVIVIGGLTIFLMGISITLNKTELIIVIVFPFIIGLIYEGCISKK